ncbi:MAG: transcriptional regulator [Pseudomonadota bacterium]
MTASAEISGVFHVGHWRVDHAARTASDGKRLRQLSPRAINVLRVLAEANGDVVSRRELLRSVWPSVTVGDESLTQAVAEIRRALDGAGKQPRLVETVPKSGYRLSVSCSFDHVEQSYGRDDEAFDLAAYILLLEARQEMIRSGPNALEHIEAIAQEAVNHCPNFALAHADLAIALANRGLFRAGARDRLKRAINVAEHAVALRPDLGFTHAAHGFVLGTLNQFEASRVAFAKAFARDPNDGEAHYLAARTAFVAGDHRTSVALAHRTSELCNDGPRSLFMAARAAIAFDEQTSARYARMCHTRTMTALNEDPRSPRANQAYGPTLAMMGDMKSARTAIEVQDDGRNTLGYHSLLGRLLLGDIEVALDLVEELVDNGWRDGTGIGSEPLMGPLMREPRYRRIVGALN